ncbi:hypothetical protein IP88_07040, partial [alpha proteobacterium AAP81b]
PVTPAPPPAAPADAAARFAAIGTDLAAVEAALPDARRAADQAIAAAAGKPADSDAAAAAEIARSRYQEAFVPVADAERRLDRLDDDLAGTAGAAEFAPQLAALRARLAALDAARDALP